MANYGRRSFLRDSVLAGGAVFGLEGLITLGALGEATGSAAAVKKGAVGYGPLAPAAAVNTGEVLIALPEGFQYTVFSRAGDPMSDGRVTPPLHDGMAAFADGSNIRLVRNHEVGGAAAFGARPYDLLAGGGTTTIVVDPVTRLPLRSFASLSGTVRNCAGGPTPWGSWISSEETTAGVASTPAFNVAHGYNFEVPVSANSEVAPVPLKAMGRFSHEAVAVDPATGIVYETEDSGDAGLYRFIPDQKGKMSSGKLQMLAVKYRPNYNTKTNQRLGRRLLCVWVDIDDADPDLEAGAPSVFAQGAAKGGAVFDRLEGCWYGDGSIFINSTSGGNAQKGQVWRYTPYGDKQGYLTLLFESPGISVLNKPDNICFTPRGGIVLCDDGDSAGEQRLHGLTQRGQIFDFAINVIPGRETVEWAGATFSPDGQTLFANIQTPGYTFAIWPKPGYAWADGAL